MANQKSVTIISGGMDSVTLAYILHSKKFDQHFLSFDYGQRHKKELERAALTASKLNSPHHIIQLDISRLLKGSSLTDNVTVPEGHYEEDSMKKTIVPGRNAVMLSIAWAVAAANGATDVAIGVHSGDHFIYPDCRPQFLARIESALYLGTLGIANQLSLLSPFFNISKAEILKQGLQIGVPYEDSWTCYNAREKSCGRCGSCVERLQSFAINNATDPLEYEDSEFWKEAVKQFELKKEKSGNNKR